MNEMQSPCLVLKYTSGTHLDVNSYPFCHLLRVEIPIDMEISQRQAAAVFPLERLARLSRTQD
jgi:hypothetical protein